jgi:hypothetical protein
MKAILDAIRGLIMIGVFIYLLVIFNAYKGTGEIHLLIFDSAHTRGVFYVTITIFAAMVIVVVIAEIRERSSKKRNPKNGKDEE